MTRQNGNLYHDDYLRQGSPTNSTFAETIPRYMASANGAIAATGVVLSAAIPLNAGDKATTITFVTATQAAVTPTAGFVALYSPAGALLAQSADFGSTARAANTAYSVALATAQLITTAGLYYVSISFTAGTVPTLKGFDLGNASMAGALGLSCPVLVQSHGSAVGATAPATIATPTTTSVIPYMAVTS
jgi:hypothetical protein